MNITLTGSSGFVGQILMSYLTSKTLSINAIGRAKLTRIGDFFNTDAVVHLAGKAHDVKKTANPDEYYHVNYDLTKQLYNAFLISEATKFIFISSVKAAADSIGSIMNEQVQSNPQTHYGKSKLLAEEYILSQPLPEGKAFYILRPCMIHGPGNKGNLNLLHSFVSKGIPYPLAAFQNKRSFLSVENLCFVIKEILEREDIPSGIYNVADDEPLSTNELVTLIAQGSGLKPKLWHINEKWIRLLASIGDKLKLPLTTERLTKLTESYVVDNSKLKKALRKELPVSAREGILKTIRSFS